MQRGSRCNKDKDATRIKMHRGSRYNEDQDSTRIKMQRGSRCNEEQNVTRIKMQRGYSMPPSPPAVLRFDSRRPNSSTCVLVHPPCTLSQNTDNKETEFSNVQGVQDENGEDEASGFGSATHQVPTNQLNLDASRHFQSKMVLPLLQLNPYQDHRSDRNKLAKLKRHASRVHFAKIH